MVGQTLYRLAHAVTAVISANQVHHSPFAPLTYTFIRSTSIERLSCLSHLFKPSIRSLTNFFHSYLTQHNSNSHQIHSKIPSNTTLFSSHNSLSLPILHSIRKSSPLSFVYTFHSSNKTDSFKHPLFNLPSDTLRTQTNSHILYIYTTRLHLTQRSSRLTEKRQGRVTEACVESGLLLKSCE